MRHRSIGKQLIYGLLIVIVAFYLLFPFYWALITSFRPSGDLFKPELWPSTFTLDNYRFLFTEKYTFGRNLLNSLVVSTVVVAISLVVALIAAYPLARIEFRGRALVMYTILAVTMFPAVAILAGMFELIRWLGLYNHIGGLVLSYLVFVLPFNIWVLATFMKELPKDLEEAALVDGASTRRIVTRVFMPLLWPAVAASGLLSFIAAWNEFLFALTFTITNDARTVPVAISMLSGSSEYESPWGVLMAASVLVTIPLIILVLICQKRIVSGLAVGAVKA